jgi:hypothetical protein
MNSNDEDRDNVVLQDGTVLSFPKELRPYMESLKDDAYVVQPNCDDPYSGIEYELE